MERPIEELRREIDEIDRRVTDLLVRRMDLAKEVGAYKLPRKLPVLAPDRERQLLEKLQDLCPEEYQSAIRAIYASVLSQSRAAQRNMGCGSYGLIGEKLQHSFSPVLHGKLARYDYRLYELQPEQLNDFLKHGSFDGLNVTIPYKKAVIPACDELTPQARRVGGVNTIVRRPDGTLLGHNTDYDGFLYLLRSAGAEVAGKKVLVLGSGGASAAVQTVLRDLHAGEIVVVSRRSQTENYETIYRHRDASYLVNATPVGMYPLNGRRLVDLSRFPHLEGVYDLIYNPARTQLLLDAQRLNIPAKGGLVMLTAQAKASAELFLDRKLPEELVDTVTAELERESLNLMLIGMPGCGKTTVGRALADRLHRPFVDLDEEIERKAGMTIPELFRTQGEEAFRKAEHEVLCAWSKKSGYVLAAGGGVVTRPENLDPLRENSTVIFLQRELEKLATKGRPLSEGADLSQLYDRRLPLYRSVCALELENGTVEETVSEIIRRLKL